MESGSTGLSVDEFIAETVAKYEKYVNPAMARLLRIMGLETAEWEAHGCIVRDVRGEEYLDCLGLMGAFGTGHAHPKVIQAVREQLERMPLSSRAMFSRPMADLSELLARITPGDLQYSFICNSGAEAVEGALKLARLATGRKGFVSTIGAFHGKTLGALSASGREVYKEPFEPLLPGFTHVPFGDLEAAEKAVGSDTAAVIIEPIQAEGGVFIPPDDYLPGLRERCDERGALLIADEIQTGFGRTGSLFACDHYGVTPDIMCLGKTLGGGVMPVGAFIARPSLWEKFISAPLLHTSTFGGNPLACTAGIAAIQVVLEEGLSERSAELGKILLDELRALQARYPSVIKEVRGRGLLVGLEVTKAGAGGMIIAEVIGRRVLAFYTLNNPTVIRLEPPLVITREQLSRAIEVFSEAVASTAEVIDEL
ncbi:MAG: aminotransferase class III-fold pyridoxal phosphate-dependent enzyme [Firmicutes bacterium]|nr:aminotransferase class III-fold pyridoxal phosphate-dependent enzyme [Bacillota bacterium]